MASTWVVLSPETGFAGTGIGVEAGVKGSDDPPPPHPPLPPMRLGGPPPPDEVELVVIGQAEEEGVTVIVAVTEAVKENEDVEASQTTVTD